jgi:hypothetical protein
MMYLEVAMNLWLFVIACYTWWFHYHLDQIQSRGNPLRSMRVIQSAKVGTECSPEI